MTPDAFLTIFLVKFTCFIPFSQGLCNLFTELCSFDGFHLINNALFLPKSFMQKRLFPHPTSGPPGWGNKRFRSYVRPKFPLKARRPILARQNMVPKSGLGVNT